MTQGARAVTGHVSHQPEEVGEKLLCRIKIGSGWMSEKSFVHLWATRLINLKKRVAIREFIEGKIETYDVS